MAVAGIQWTGLVMQVRDRLREDIAHGRLVTDRIYSVAEIAASVGVSRTPVREALLQLEESGLIRFHRNRGFSVITVSQSDLAEIFQLRLALEVPATRRVARHPPDGLVEAMHELLGDMREAGAKDDRDGFMKADRRFHEQILTSIGNVRLTRAVNGARDAIFSRGLSTEAPDRTWHDLVVEHEAVLDAIREKRPVAAGAAMAAHLVNTGTALLSLSPGAAGTDGWAEDFCL